jgi:hypothetical protein
MGEAENSQAKAYDLSGRQEADRGGAESKVGEVEKGSLRALIAAFHISRA